MPDYTFIPTLKLEWSKASALIADAIEKTLHRPIRGNASFEDDYYWDFQTTNTKISIDELEALIAYVHGDKHMRLESLPVDADASSSIGEGLSRALLKRALRMTWCHESISEDAIWLIGVENQHEGGFCECP